jgi:hypothetical protein
MKIVEEIMEASKMLTQKEEQYSTMSVTHADLTLSLDTLSKEITKLTTDLIQMMEQSTIQLGNPCIYCTHFRIMKKAGDFREKSKQGKMRKTCDKCRLVDSERRNSKKGEKDNKEIIV